METTTCRHIASRVLAVCLMLALAVMPVSCAREATPVRTPTPDKPWPEATEARIQDCMDTSAGAMADGDHHIRFTMRVDTNGQVQLVYPEGSYDNSLRDVGICVQQALEAMKVPQFVLDRGLSPSNQGRVSDEARHLVGDPTALATSTAAEGVLVQLEPIVVRAGPVGVAIFLAVVVVAAVATVAAKKMSAECEEEWRIALMNCRDWLKLPNPPRGLTGGHTNPYDCARGHVSEECEDANEVDWGNKGRPGRRY